jgi:hypothetical protein
MRFYSYTRYMLLHMGRLYAISLLYQADGKESERSTPLIPSCLLHKDMVTTKHQNGSEQEIALKEA